MQMSDECGFFFELGRYCARYTSLDLPYRNTLLSVFLRLEAERIVQREALTVDRRKFCAVIADPSESFLSQAERVAWDVWISMKRCLHEYEEGVEVENILTLIDASNTRVMTTTQELEMEDDILWMGDFSDHLFSSQNLDEFFRRIDAVYESDRFLGLSRRLTLTILPFWLSRVLGFHEFLPLPCHGLPGEHEGADHLSRLRSCVSDSLRMMDQVLSFKQSALAALSPERSSSRLPQAIDFILAYPVFTVNALADHLGISVRGANYMLDTMLASGVVKLDTPRPRNRLFVCEKSLLL